MAWPCVLPSLTLSAQMLRPEMPTVGLELVMKVTLWLLGEMLKSELLSRIVACGSLRLALRARPRGALLLTDIVNMRSRWLLMKAL